MNGDAEYERILSALYEAAMRPDAWQPALAGLAQWVGADVFHFVRWDLGQQQGVFNVHSQGIERPIEQYGSYYARIDPRRLLVSAGEAGVVSACQRHFDDRYVGRDEFYQDYLGAWGMRRSLSTLVLDREADQVMLGLVRGRERGLFDDEEIARLTRVVPHLQRACGMWLEWQRLHERSAAGEQACAATGLAWLGLDAQGRVLHASALAERLLQRADSVLVRAGRLGAHAPGDSAKIIRALAQVLRGEPPQEFMVAGRLSGPQACAVGVARLVEGGQAPGPVPARTCALVMLRPRDAKPAASAAGLAQLFGLTPAEAKVALALLAGQTPGEYAQASGLSMATVRTHLRALFAKTGTRRQAEAVQVLRGLSLL